MGITRKGKKGHKNQLNRWFLGDLIDSYVVLDD
jgi:hypothetical protein